MDWVKGHGICSEASYPYKGVDGTCKACTAVAHITGRHDNAATEAALISALNNQPVSVAIEADQQDFQFYSGGIFNGVCGTKLDHGVLAVGYGDTDIIVKNSWGTGWGEAGYIRMHRGNNKCGIDNATVYPTA